jgi:thiol-disulfide isomerase/thioredoxin
LPIIRVPGDENSLFGGDTVKQKRMHTRWILLGAVAMWAGLSLLHSKPAWALEDWNDTQINWQPYEQGLAEAKKQKKPVCLVFYTEWCSHCKKYSGIFHDPRVVERAKDFVMIRVDKDKNQELSRRHALDGQYIPRTYFMSSRGTIDPDIHAPRERYKYFYDEHNPASLLAGMEAALKTLY